MTVTEKLIGQLYVVAIGAVTAILTQRLMAGGVRFASDGEASMKEANAFVRLGSWAVAGGLGAVIGRTVGQRLTRRQQALDRS